MGKGLQLGEPLMEEVTPTAMHLWSSLTSMRANVLICLIHGLKQWCTRLLWNNVQLSRYLSGIDEARFELALLLQFAFLSVTGKTDKHRWYRHKTTATLQTHGVCAPHMVQLQAENPQAEKEVTRTRKMLLFIHHWVLGLQKCLSELVFFQYKLFSLFTVQQGYYRSR